MCGVAGFWSSARLDEPLNVIASRMGNSLSHRGPDDAGVWVDESAGFALAHRRLSILDLSEAGRQPMVSASGRYVLAFNGEIYNHRDLRKELENSGKCTVAWRGHSDTETLLAGIDAWGFESTLKRTVGMFAVALWDRADRTLLLARDRMGEKPLYYGWVRDVLVFASELKAIKRFPGFNNDVDRNALALFLRYNYVPTPWSIYRSIWKLPPATWIEFTAEDLLRARGERGTARAYWCLRDAAEAGVQDPFVGTESEAAEELDSLLRQSVAGQMIADVPLGALLSGGVDSSTVVAVMQSLSSRPVKTFTIGFHENNYNEAAHAKEVSGHLGTDHTELYVTPSEALAVIPKLPTLYDEPFADSSQVPTHLVCALARRHVAVALSGDGGDEFFGGYNRYLWVARLWRVLASTPSPLRRLAAGVLRGVSPAGWDWVFRALSPLLPMRLRFNLPGDKLHKAALLFSARSPGEVYLRLVSQWADPGALVLGAREDATTVVKTQSRLDLLDFERCMMYLDAITYLPDDILVKVDRAAMGVSLETRAPLLDHRVVEFAWRLPLSMKIRNDQSKWILRRVLYRYVPKELIERPKMGFGVPIDRWLRGPLRDWAEALLDESRIRYEGYFDPRPVRRKWIEHLSGRRNWAYHLWGVLMFQAWSECWRPRG